MMIDTSQITAFANKLAAAPAKKRPKITQVVKKAAQNVKMSTHKDLDTSWWGSFREITLQYEIRDHGVIVEADIAPIKGSSSNLDNLAFFGSATGGGTHDFYPHARAEFPNLVRELHKVASGL